MWRLKWNWRETTRSAARIYYKKCIEHANGLGYNRDRAFLKLGWIFMDDKMYPQAKYAYDSVNANDPRSRTH